MKSIAFTLLRDKLVKKKKRQTYRVVFIPNFYVGDVVKIVFKHKNDDGELLIRETLYHAKITEIYPKRIKDLTKDEAELDGFKRLQDFQDGVMELNNVKDKRRWGFIIRWNPIQSLDKFISGGD